jgi:hypothetical protein
MQLNITINLDGQAFDGAGCGAEVARILHKVAGRVLNDATLTPDSVMTLADINGNICGSCEVEV